MVNGGGGDSTDVEAMAVRVLLARAVAADAGLLSPA